MRFKKLCKISVSRPSRQIANPAKSIEQKDVLDLSGLEVELIWNDGSPNTTVNLAQFNDYGLTVSPADGTLLNTIGTNTVTVSHTYTKDGTSETETAKDSFTFPVQGVTSLEWYAEPAKKEYTAGEVLDMSDAQVILRWSDSREITKDFPPVSYANFGGNFLTVSPNPATGLTKGHTMVTITHTLSGETLQYPLPSTRPRRGFPFRPRPLRCTVTLHLKRRS